MVFTKNSKYKYLSYSVPKQGTRQVGDGQVINTSRQQSRQGLLLFNTYLPTGEILNRYSARLGIALLIIKIAIQARKLLLKAILNASKTKYIYVKAPVIISNDVIMSYDLKNNNILC